MKTLTVAKAEPVHPKSVEGCLIYISDPLPNFSNEDWEEKSTEFFEGQAAAIVDALQENLPGGTFDAVLRELCKRKACLFRVPIYS